MRDPAAGKYQNWYKHEFTMAEKILAPYNGELEWSTNDYVAFTFTSDKVKLIFYPHKVNTGNRHIRVRDGGSKTPEAFKRAVALLGIGSGYNCTFSVKNYHNDSYESQIARSEHIEFGWANKPYRT